MFPPYNGTELCAEIDPAVFFPEATGSRITYKTKIEQAKAICTYCPLQQACLKYAESIPGTNGVWGGKWFGYDAPGYISPIAV